MSEAFNAWILDARHKDIISLNEELRRMVMTRLHVKRDWASSWRTNMAPRALEKLEDNKTIATKCNLTWNGNREYEVVYELDQHNVDLNTQTCTCRVWELSGIPCGHVIACLYQEGQRPEDYVFEYYTKQRYLAAYNVVLRPCRGKQFYKKDVIPIKPPVVKVMPGRPKRSRNKKNDVPVETANDVPKVKKPRVYKKVITRHCKECGAVGHNSRSCPKKVTDSSASNATNANTANTATVNTATVNNATTNTDNTATNATNATVNNATTNTANTATNATVNNASTNNATVNTATTNSGASNVIHMPGDTHIASSNTVQRGNGRTQSTRGRGRGRKYFPKSLGVLTNTRTGEQILYPGTNHQIQVNHTWKGPGLSWNGNIAVSSRQLQSEAQPKRKRGRPRKNDTPSTQGSQSFPPNVPPNMV